MEILLIDDDPAIRLSLAGALREGGHRVQAAVDGTEGMRWLREEAYDLVVTDVRLPGVDGFEILQYVRQTTPAPDVLLITAHGAVDDAVAAMRLQASDYLVKPFALADLVERVERIDGRRALQRTLTGPAAAAPKEDLGIVGGSAIMAYVRTQIVAVAASDASTLILGESGTGKELVARALHAQSKRRDGPFVAINCASFPENLLEAELLGHERGAFTGADRRRVGRFAAARGGTLFLDEIGEMAPLSQAKLLRVIEERAFSPLGTNEVVPLDTHLVSATNAPLERLIGEGRFREDLLYRIQVFCIEIPPLRERQRDLPELVAHFLRRLACDEPVRRVSREAWNALAEYGFPGNVRELEHAIEHAVVMARSAAAEEIQLDHLPAPIRDAAAKTDVPGDPSFPELGPAVREFERQHVLRALAEAQGHRTHAAALLGISRKNLWEKLRAHQITDAEIEEAVERMRAE